MTRYQIRKAIQSVGSREKLNHMVLQVAKMWDAIFLEGLEDHLKANPLYPFLMRGFEGILPKPEKANS